MDEMSLMVQSKNLELFMSQIFNCSFRNAAKVKNRELLLVLFTASDLAKAEPLSAVQSRMS